MATVDVDFGRFDSESKTVSYYEVVASHGYGLMRNDVNMGCYDSEDEVVKAAQDLREENPENDGWYSGIQAWAINEDDSTTKIFGC